MDLKELLQFSSNSTLQFFYTELLDTDSARDLSQARCFGDNPRVSLPFDIPTEVDQSAGLG